MTYHPPRDPFANIDWTTIGAAFGVKVYSTFIDGQSVINVQKGDYTACAFIDDHLMEDMVHRSAYLVSMIEDLALKVGLDDRRHSKESTLDTEIYLSLALLGCSRNVKEADLRGDVAGSDAWLIVVDAIETAIKISRKSASQQTWSMKGPL